MAEPLMSYSDHLAFERRAEEQRLAENIRTRPTQWDEAKHRIGRNLYPLALIACSHYLDTAELAKAVEDAWTMPDNPLTQLGQKDWLAYFRKVGFLDNTTQAPPPDRPITVWRGATPSRRRRWSWTSDPERAAWFAARLTTAGLDGRIWTTTAPPDAQLAHFHGADSRDEDEHVIYTRGLKIMEVDHG